MPIDPQQLSRPLFHVRYIQDGVEQEQIFSGVPDGNGGFDINVPTPCTLLSVTQHGFPYCLVCDGGPIRGPREVSGSFDIPLTPEVKAFYQHVFGPGSDREQLIRAEVEAMDWPEVIGE